MALVLVERRFDDPVRFQEIQEIEDAGSWCLEAYGVRFLKTFFSRDRRRMLCLYEAPDAEAVRLAESQAKVPFERAWSCANLLNTGPVEGDAAGEYVVVERVFPQPVTSGFIAGNIERAGWCLEAHRVDHLESYLGTDGLRMVCLFRAPDAEAVRAAHRQGRVPYTEVWPSTVHRPPPPAA